MASLRSESGGTFNANCGAASATPCDAAAPGSLDDADANFRMGAGLMDTDDEDLRVRARLVDAADAALRACTGLIAAADVTFGVRLCLLEEAEVDFRVRRFAMLILNGVVVAVRGTMQNAAGANRAIVASQD